MRVKIENFQSIKDLEIEVEGFTTIVGKSNIGKSAIVRAIQGALTNREGDAFVTKGEKHTSVTLEAPEISLVWKKGGGHNDYEINGEELNLVGRGVPPHIKEAGFGEMEVGRTSMNVQVADQFNPLFLLDASGAIAAEAISDVGRLGDVQEALRRCESDRRAAGSERKVRLKDLDAVREELNAYEAFEEDAEYVRSVLAMEAECDAQQKEVTLLEEMVKRAGELEARVAGLAGVEDVGVAATERVEAAAQEYENVKAYDDRLKRNAQRLEDNEGVERIEIPEWKEELYASLKQVEVLSDRLARSVAPIKKYGGVEDVVIPVEDEVAFMREGYEDFRGRNERLKKIASAITTAKTEIAELEERISAVEGEFRETLREHGYCPTCEKNFE